MLRSLFFSFLMLDGISSLLSGDWSVSSSLNLIGSMCLGPSCGDSTSEAINRSIPLYRLQLHCSSFIFLGNSEASKPNECAQKLPLAKILTLVLVLTFVLMLESRLFSQLNKDSYACACACVGSENQP